MGKKNHTQPFNPIYITFVLLIILSVFGLFIGISPSIDITKEEEEDLFMFKSDLVGNYVVFVSFYQMFTNFYTLIARYHKQT